MAHILPTRNSLLSTTIDGNEVFDSNTINIDLSKVGGIQKFKEIEIGRYEVINLIRIYALGDLIQLVPIARYLKNQGICKQVQITTSNRFLSSLKRIFPDILFSTVKNISNDVLKINLNSILEHDHSLKNKERNLHRVHIYANFLNIKDRIHLDWSSRMKEKDGKCFINEEDNVIAVQIRGSGSIKTLPFDFIKKMCKRIAKQNKVILIDHDSNYGFEGDNIINACGKMGVLDIVRTLENCKCVITMDSGILWLAHVAKCPVITFLGSTREHERISLHPLYPHKAKSINLSQEVGCEPCFETKIYCEGKIRCMNEFNYDTIIKKVLNNLEIILSEV